MSRSPTGPTPTGPGPEPGIDAFCRACGRPAAVCGGCRRPLDPPRFCPSCGRRMTVAVTPTAVSARCRDHGSVTDP